MILEELLFQRRFGVHYGLKKGTPLEIFTDKEGEVILRILPDWRVECFCKEYAESLAQTTGMIACITDHDQVVAASGQAAGN